MEQINWGVVIELLALVASGIGVYAAIRSDLALIHERHSNMKEWVGKIDTKVDSHIANGHCHRRTSDV
jgi:hypothetical protein